MRKKLTTLLEENRGNITEQVIKEALDYDNPKTFLEDVLKHGCISGMVNSMIYYEDTHKFYDKYYNEIEEIRSQLKDEGLELEIPSHDDLKNHLAWLSFEHRSYELYDELGFNR